MPFGGTNGGPGEVFVDLAWPYLTTALQPWSAAVGETVHGVTVPNHPSLVGLPLFTQGVVFAFNPNLSLVFTNALDVRLGI